MLTEKGYDGWVNFETWVMATWLDSEQEMYIRWRDKAKNAVITLLDNDPGLIGDEAKLLDQAKSALAIQLYDWLEQENPLRCQETGFADLLDGALTKVDCLGIAKHYLSNDVVHNAMQTWWCENYYELE